MVISTYSSGLVSESFWFLEFKEYLKLKNSGMTELEIKNEAVERNCFGAPNEYRASRIFGYIKRRVDTLDEKAVELFFNSDLATQKLMDLICILRNSRIFFEFVNEVYREKIILGFETIEATDVNTFFANKAAQSDDVAKWTGVTLKRLKGAFFTILTNSGLLAAQGKKRMIKVPITDLMLEKYLKDNGEADFTKALTGEY